MIFGRIFASPCFHRNFMDLGPILEAIWEGIWIGWTFFCTLKSTVILECISELPRGAPGSPRELGEHTTELAKSLPAPKGNVPVT